MRRRHLLVGALATGIAKNAGAGIDWRRESGPWPDILARMPAEWRARLLEPAHEIALLYTRIDRDAVRTPAFTHHALGYVRRRWYGTASLVKLPAALLTLERLEQHGLGIDARIALAAAPRTGEWPQGERLEQDVQRTLRRIFTVSDNAEYNRLYEFLGPDAIAARLTELGYTDARLISRLGSPDPVANRRVGAAHLLAPDGRVVARWPERLTLVERRFPFVSAHKGKGWWNGNAVIPGPHDFAHVNFVPLEDLHHMLLALLFPNAMAPSARWRIGTELRSAALREMARFPRESVEPVYPESDYPDGYVKFFIFGNRGDRAPPGLRCYGKSGQAYGYLNDVEYVVDREAGVEFLLSATIHVNADGVFNDDRYEYDAVGFPFLYALGQAVLEYERARPRTVRPDFASLPWP
jgi:hypothetical protein